MGCFPSSEDDRKNQQVESDLKADEIAQRSIHKLLLLGAGGSGKSTIFKQLQRIYNHGFSEKERAAFKTQIYDQIIDQMQLLVAKCAELSMHPDHEHLQISPRAQESAAFISRILPGGSEVTTDIAEHIKILWKDRGIQEGFKMRNLLCIVESSGYFFENVDRVARADYSPTDEDLLLTRHRTTGMHEQKFMINGKGLAIVDVGGQRSERRKWINCFTGVTAVIYVVSLSGYDEVLYEDETRNDMRESLQVFNQTVNSHWFQEKPFILFLNKSDLFYKKLEYSRLEDYFDEFETAVTDQDDLRREALDFIRKMFEKVPEDGSRQLYTHVTCATDQGNIQKVFVDVQHIIINVSLAENGIV